MKIQQTRYTQVDVVASNDTVIVIQNQDVILLDKAIIKQMLLDDITQWVTEWYGTGFIDVKSLVEVLVP